MRGNFRDHGQRRHPSRAEARRGWGCQPALRCGHHRGPSHRRDTRTSHGPASRGRRQRHGRSGEATSTNRIQRASGASARVLDRKHLRAHDRPRRRFPGTSNPDDSHGSRGAVGRIDRNHYRASPIRHQVDTVRRIVSQTPPNRPSTICLPHPPVPFQRRQRLRLLGARQRPAHHRPLPSRGSQPAEQGPLPLGLLPRMRPGVPLRCAGGTPRRHRLPFPK